MPNIDIITLVSELKLGKVDDNIAKDLKLLLDNNKENLTQGNSSKDYYKSKTISEILNMINSRRIVLAEDYIFKIIDVINSMELFYRKQSLKKILDNKSTILTKDNVNKFFFNVINTKLDSSHILAILLDSKRMILTEEKIDLIFAKILDIKDIEKRVSAITSFIKNIDEINAVRKNKKNLSYSDIITMFGIEFRIDLIATVLSDPFFTKDNQLKLFISFINENDSYKNNDYFKTELLYMVLSFYDIINSSNVHLLNNVFKNYQHDNLLIDLLEKLLEKKIISNELDCLNLVKGRIRTRYNFLSKLVENNKNLKTFLKENAIVDLRNLFGNIENITILDIISYYDIIGKLDVLHGYFNNETKRSIKNNLKTSDKWLVLTDREVKKLAHLLYGKKHMDKNIQKITKTLCKVKDIINYFKDNLPKIPEISKLDINNYEIGNNTELIQGRNILDSGANNKLNTDASNKLNTDDLNKSFRLFLNSGSDITPFLDQILGEEWRINVRNKDKIVKNCEDFKKELCYLFKKKDGLTNFISTIYSSDDGCVVNLGNQIKKIVYIQLFSGDMNKTLLFDFLSNKIISSILNSGGDIMSGNTDFLNHSTVKNSYIHGNALLEELSKGIGYKESNATINKYLEDDDSIRHTIFLDSNSEFIEKKFNKFASCLVIENTTPDLLKKISKIDKNFYKDIKDEINKLKRSNTLPLPSLCEASSNTIKTCKTI